jgi:hypothetical protein
MNFVVRDPAGMTLQALFQSSGVDGVRARTQLFERAVEGLTGLISRLRAPDAEVLRFPPVTNRSHIEKSGYLHSFPHLLGAVCCLHGGEGEIRAAISGPGAKEWVTATTPTDLVLTPAACYPLYPLVASRGAIAAGGLVFDVASDCFRHEPSQDIDRFQSFRMREFVCMGRPIKWCRFASSGWRAAPNSPISWACRTRSRPPAIRSSAAPASSWR